MKPGRELDALIHKEVIKKIPCDSWKIQTHSMSGPEYIKWDKCEHGEDECYPPGLLPAYSTSIGAAWMVLEAGEDRHGVPTLFQLNEYNDGPNCKMGWKENNRFVYSAYGETFPHAICLAALKAVREDKT